MAENTSFPQIPTTVWWGVRDLLIRSPTATFDDKMLAATLNVQNQAAKVYISELTKVGILDDEGKATPAANKWRLDDSYNDAVTEIVKGIYPENLLTIAPLGQADRQTVVNWFMQHGLGKGAAGNKAATYLLISSPEPSSAADQLSKSGSKPKATKPSETRASKTKNSEPRKPKDASSDQVGFGMPLNVNVQIHISADSSSEQIETIFSSMRKYLSNENSN